MDTKENDYRNFEKDVYELISMCLSKDEIIKFDDHFDFFVPNGVKKLGWEKGTCIEVKYRLMPYSFERIKYNFDMIQPKRIIVICNDERDIPKAQDILICKRQVNFLSYNKLLKNIKSLNIQKSAKTEKEDVIDLKYKIGKEKNNIDKAKMALKDNKVSLFLGAGVSRLVGSIGWDKLLNELCLKRRLSIDTNSDKRCISGLEKGRYIIDDYIGKKNSIPKRFYEDMRTFLYSNIKRQSNDIIEIIATLITKCKIESVITYNYDDLVEQEINDNYLKYHIKCQPIYDKSGPIADNRQYIYHVHGYLSKDHIQSKEIILGEKEYHKVYQDSYNWSNVEQLHALNRSTCFFIGLSMTDPNLRRLMDISFDGSDKKLVHYAFLCKMDHDISLTSLIMHDFGVNCIWYDNHEDLTGLLYSLIDGI